MWLCHNHAIAHCILDSIKRHLPNVERGIGKQRLETEKGKMKIKFALITHTSQSRKKKTNKTNEVHLIRDLAGLGMQCFRPGSGFVGSKKFPRHEGAWSHRIPGAGLFRTSVVIHRLTVNLTHMGNYWRALIRSFHFLKQSMQLLAGRSGQFRDHRWVIVVVWTE